MTEKLDTKKFGDALLELSRMSTTDTNGGETQEIVLELDLSEALDELSSMEKDNQQI